MKTKTKAKAKALTMSLCAVLLVAATVFATMAYLTDSKTVVNTFTVGKVAITLDEAKVDEYGVPVPNAERVITNSYKLIPGHTYDKDPTVTVLAGSEDCYVKMTLTYNCADFIDSKDDLDFHAGILGGYDRSIWVYQAGSRVYSADGKSCTMTFCYKDKVDASASDTTLEPLFTDLTLPDSFEQADIEAMEGFRLTINAYAVQADGFDSADAAFAAVTF